MNKLLYKIKEYNFDLKGLEKSKGDLIGENIGIGFNASFYIAISGLFIAGAIGKNFIISYVCCTVVSRTVKAGVKKGLI